ncbi:MAG: methyl-accepting chemotaxis protein [Planctomycetota bacterium]
MFRWFTSPGLRTKVLSVLFVAGVGAASLYAMRIHSRAVDDAIAKARDDADNLLARSTQMFLVSTKKFHDDFQRTKDNPEEHKRVLDDWSRTIFAVDDAVIADFGADKPRVKLTGDAEVYGYKPLGTATKLETAFEREAAQKLVAGEPRVEQIDDAFLRVAVPLPAQAHPGCAECHFASVEGFDADMSREQLLGSLNAYVPLASGMAHARSEAAASIGYLILMIGGLIGVVYFFLNYSVVRPIRRCMASIVALARRDFTQKCDVKGRDEIGRMSAAINESIDTTKKAFEEIDDKVIFYQGILDAIPFPLSVTDNDLNWTFINKAAEDASGAKREQVLGKHCSGWGADICNTERCGVCMANKQGGKARSYFTQPSKPGMQYLVDASFIHDRHSQKIGHVEVVQDITAAEQVRKYQAQEVDRLARNLTELANGNVALETVVGEANEYTKETREYFLRVNAALDTTLTAVRRLVTDANALAEAASRGDLSVRADAAAHAGAYRGVVEGVNRLFDAVVTPLHEASRVLGAMSQKDFTQEVQGAYAGEFEALKQNVNSVVASVRSALSEITESASQFAEGARVIAESSQSLAQGAQTQSSSVEEMSASIEELARSVEAVKGNATEATRVASEANRLAEQGGSAVEKSSESMELIRTSSQKISEIIQVISEIASQTNLLALNAAIEAARAGEHGMGFAVVADEVRKLAERSNQAAREISSLIKESTQRVEEGAQLSDQTAESLKQIIAAAEATAAKIAEIAAASVQQAANAAEVSKAIQSVAQVTEQSAAGSEEMASSSEELGAQASALRTLVSEFNVGTSR